MRPVLRSFVAVGFSLLAFACSAASGDKFEEGKQYKKVREISKPLDAKRIEVAEFFWYGCSHCFAFDPVIKAWEKAKPADVDFVRMPHSLGQPRGVLHAKAFYAAQALKVGAKMHDPIFDAIHNKNNPLSTEAQLAALFQQVAGVTPDVFSGTLNSFVVDAQVRKTELAGREYGVTSVPTVVVGGKYMTGPAMTKNLDETIVVINYLIDKVRKERGGK